MAGESGQKPRVFEQERYGERFDGSGEGRAKREGLGKGLFGSGRAKGFYRVDPCGVAGKSPSPGLWKTID